MSNACLEALLKIQPYIDGELGTAEAEFVRHHLHVCTPCAPALDYFRSLRNVVQRAASVQAAPDHLKARITALIQSSRRG